MKASAFVVAAGVALGMAAPAQAGDGTKGAALGAGIGALGGAVVSNGDVGTTVGGAVIGGLLGYGLSGDGKKKVVEHHHHHYVAKDRPGPRRDKHDNGRRRRGHD